MNTQTMLLSISKYINRQPKLDTEGEFEITVNIKGKQKRLKK